MSKKELKNHIKAPGTTNVGDKLFGVTQQTLLKAVHGDEQAIKDLADTAIDAEEVLKNIPNAVEHTKKIIEATNALNVANTEIIKTIGQYAPATTQAMYDAQLAEQKLGHQLSEKQSRFNNQTAEEAKRHEQEVSYTQMDYLSRQQLALARYTDRIQAVKQRLPEAHTERAKQLEIHNKEKLWKEGSKGQLTKPNNIWESFKSNVGWG